MTVKRPLSKAFLILSLFSILLLGFSSSGDQPDFPNIYIDKGCAGTHVGSEANPYDALADVNWTTGGDNSIFDYLAGTPAASPTIHLNKGDTWREQLTVGCSGTATYPIVITSYGEGADPIINGADVVGTWTAETGCNQVDAADFEEGDVTDYDSVTTWPAGNTDLTATIGAKRTGTYGADHYTPGDATDERSYGTHTFDAETEIWVRVYFNINDLTMADEDSFCFLKNNMGSSQGYFELTRNGDDYQLNVKLDGANLGATTINKVTWNSLVIWYVAADGTGFEKIWINDVLVQDNTDLSNPSRTWTDLKYGISYDKDAGTSGHIYFDDIVVCDSELLENIWKATLTTEPSQVFFDGTRGNKQIVLGDVDSANDWYWAGNVLYIYYTEDPDGAVVIEASQRDCAIDAAEDDYITIDGLNLKNANDFGVKVVESDNFTIQNCEIQDTKRSALQVGGSDNFHADNCIIHHALVEHGIYLDGLEANGTDDPIVENCTIYSNGNHGIQINGNNTYQVTNPIIRYNIIRYQIHGHGIADISSNGGQYYYNLIYDNSTYGIVCHYDTDDDTDHSVPSVNSKIYNNVIIMPNGSSRGIYIKDYATGHTVKNNIIYARGTLGALIQKATTGSATIDYNCYYKSSYTGQFIWNGTSYDTLAAWQTASSQDTNSIASNPLFIDAANGNFKLNPHSLCVNAGTDVSLTEDYEGLKIRHAPDIGAHENQANVLFFAWFLRDFLGVNK